MDRAIEIARRASLAASHRSRRWTRQTGIISRRVFFRFLDSPGVQFVGEISEAEKSDFLGGALALLFPISWPEPFGLVMIEAMACGTPVIAFNQGAVPEVIRDGKTGFIVENVEQAVHAVAHLDTIDRAVIRAAFERRFSVGGNGGQIRGRLCRNHCAK